MKDELVELHFIDGPLAGTRKMEQLAILSLNRTYRHLQPLLHKAVKVPNKADQNWAQVTCIEYHYLSFSLPRASTGTARFAMLLEQEIY